jgi:hypothetical protein
MATETWDLWFAGAGATGMSFARSRIEPQTSLLVHAAPPVLDVHVRDADGQLVASGESLRRAAEGPISRLRREGSTITLEDLWPGPDALGSVVILAGGEAGVLKTWWHADDRSEWRWQLELYNHV